MARGNSIDAVSGTIESDSQRPRPPVAGATGPTVRINAPEPQEAERSAPLVRATPAASRTPLYVGGAVVAVAASTAGYLWLRRQQTTEAPATPGTEVPPTTRPGTPPAPPAAPPAASPTNPGIVPQGNPDPNFWGTTTRGAEFRPLFAKLEQVTGMPLRLFLCVVANREAGWNRKARNLTKGETDASKDAIKNGIARGNPPPKFADSLAAAGSGGLAGGLAPYVAWIGMDEDFMPYLDEDYTIIEDPVVAGIFAAKYYQRIVSLYPVHATPGRPSSEDNFRVRLGWASPSVLKNDPTGKLAGEVRGRMEADLAQLGLKITDLPPPDASHWPGLQAVVEAMKGFPVTWK